MYKYLIYFFLTSSLFAVQIDPNISSFDQGPKRRIESFDFQGDYPQLTHIKIDGKRKTDVELLLKGSYPLLERIHYDGGFGIIKGSLTGHFPKLNEITIVGTHALLDLDLETNWEKKCVINIASKGEITVNLPKDVAMVVNVTTFPTSKVHLNHPTLYQRKRKISHRIFCTTQEENKEPLLTINVKADRNPVTFN
jgi:hypothetical protein